MMHVRTETCNATRARGGSSRTVRGLPLSIQNGRLVLAIAIAVAIVFAPAVIDKLFNLSSSAETASEETIGLADEALVSNQEGRTPDEVLDRAEELLGETLLPMPPWFSEQVGLPSGAREVRVSADGAVVGFILDGSPDSAVDDVDNRMRAHGWTSADLGGIDGKTYIKTSGKSEWIVMTATQVGSSTSVVMRCMEP